MMSGCTNGIRTSKHFRLERNQHICVSLAIKEDSTVNYTTVKQEYSSITILSNDTVTGQITRNSQNTSHAHVSDMYVYDHFK